MITQIINPANYAVTLHAALTLLVGAAVAVLGAYVLVKEHGSRVGLVFFAYTLCVSIWLAGFGMVAASTEAAQARWWIRAALLGVTFMPSLILILALVVAQRTHLLWKLIRASIAVSGLFYVCVLYTDLYVAGLYHYSWGYYPKFGPVGIAYIFYFGGVMVYVLRLYWIEYRSSTNQRRKKRIQGLLIAYSIGYVASVDFFASLGIPVYPFGYILIVPFLVITANVIMKYQLVDITPALAAEQILETMQGAVIAVDLDGKIRVVNRAAREMLGLQESDLLGRSIAALPGLPPTFVNSTQIGDHEASSDICWPARNGPWSAVSIAATPVTGRNKETVGFVYVANDITERKQAEKSIMKLNDELESKIQERSKQLLAAQEELVRKEKLATLGQLAGSVGHELRNPLGVMNNAVYYLQTVLSGADETVREYLDIIKSEISGAEQIVSDLLDAVRAKPPHAVFVGIKELVKASLGKCKIPESVRVKLNIPEDLLPVKVDPLQMTQVFINLVSNGVEAILHGGSLEITAVEDKQDGVVKLSFRDTGAGIAPENMSKLFHPLFTTKARGIGLGLTVVKNLIEANGGRIEVLSEFGKGTTFTVILPCEMKGMKGEDKS